LPSNGTPNNATLTSGLYAISLPFISFLLAFYEIFIMRVL
jgi:hypothetical protein